ncbi:homeobox domain-containing protein 6 [Vairimorpha necatrix]|uniref:Homeobox domain-containing protein 6 n=1 Tax=Vairimorpha necatrix TaxID=6039 RepID=A0AAX4J9X7_9MICR
MMKSEYKKNQNYKKPRTNIDKLKRSTRRNANSKNKGTGRKRVRTVMDANQSKILIDSFLKNSFPSTELRDELSRSLKIKSRTIQIWFQNQRQKIKNKNLALSKNEDEYPGMPFRSLNILATAAVATLYEKEMNKEDDDKPIDSQ